MKVLGTIFNQRLRQTQGFVESIVTLMSVHIEVPNYSTLSRRIETMKIPDLSSMLISEEPINIAIDSTGLKVYGIGEWFITKRGKKHQSWQKLHIAIDINSQKIIAAELTPQDIGDCTVVPELLDKIDHTVNKMLGDTAYDNFWVYEELHKYKIKPVIPPRSSSLLSKRYRENPTHRDKALLDRHELGIQKWQQVTTYTKRRLVETAMSRYKKLIGNTLYSRKTNNRLAEIKIGWFVLNKMFDLGKPAAYKFKKSA